VIGVEGRINARHPFYGSNNGSEVDALRDVRELAARLEARFRTVHAYRGRSAAAGEICLLLTIDASLIPNVVVIVVEIDSERARVAPF